MEPCSAVGRSETLEEKRVRVEDGDISPVGSSEYRNDVAEVLGRIYDLLGLVNNKVEDVKVGLIEVVRKLEAVSEVAYSTQELVRDKGSVLDVDSSATVV